MERGGYTFKKEDSPTTQKADQEAFIAALNTLAPNNAASPRQN